jgi:hypothetical protein
VYINPFGSYNFYAGKKSGYGNASMTVLIPTRSGHMDVYITKVFKGQLKYREIYLYDGTWFQDCRWFMRCKYVSTPRTNRLDEARFDGVSADGQRATFQYGPVATRGKGWAGGMRGWDQNEWDKLPKGVQVE